MHTLAVLPIPSTLMTTPPTELPTPSTCTVATSLVRSTTQSGTTVGSTIALESPANPPVEVMALAARPRALGEDRDTSLPTIPVIGLVFV